MTELTPDLAGIPTIINDYDSIVTSYIEAAAIMAELGVEAHNAYWTNLLVDDNGLEISRADYRDLVSVVEEDLDDLDSIAVVLRTDDVLEDWLDRWRYKTQAKNSLGLWRRLERDTANEGDRYGQFERELLGLYINSQQAAVEAPTLAWLDWQEAAEDFAIRKSLGAHAMAVMKIRVVRQYEQLKSEDT